MKTLTVRTHQLPSKCYACDHAVIGVAMRRDGEKPFGLEGYDGAVEWPVPACARHAEFNAKFIVLCRYCSQPTRNGSLYIDTNEGGEEYAHRRCHEEACR